MLALTVIGGVAAHCKPCPTCEPRGVGNRGGCLRWVTLTGALGLQTVQDGRQFLKYVDPRLGVPLPERDYGGNCLIYDADNESDPFHNVWVRTRGRPARALRAELSQEGVLSRRCRRRGCFWTQVTMQTCVGWGSMGPGRPGLPLACPRAPLRLSLVGAGMGPEGRVATGVDNPEGRAATGGDATPPPSATPALGPVGLEGLWRGHLLSVVVRL